MKVQSLWGYIRRYKEHSKGRLSHFEREVCELVKCVSEVCEWEKCVSEWSVWVREVCEHSTATALLFTDRNTDS